jgi:hypothetical protein
MARYVRNPEVFGEDVMPLAIEAVGLGATAFANDKLVSPVVKQVVPVGTDSTTDKAVDAVTTGLTAWLLGEGVGMADRVFGRRVRRGGMLLAVGKVISIVLPGFSLSGSLPTSFSFPKIGASTAKTVAGASTNPALPAATTSNASLSALGVGSMGL